MARRQAETHARILAIAARRFGSAGLDAVNLDQLADEADIAKGTLYKHFPSKESLVRAALRPVLELSVERIAEVRGLGPKRGIAALLRLYLDIWQAHPDALRLSYRVQDIPLDELTELHATFLDGVRDVFARAARIGLLRSGDPLLSARMMARLAVPLLELFDGAPQADRLFVESLSGLLLRR